MMTTSYTVTIREAETQLRDLVVWTQATRRPIVLTAEETTQPVAVLIEADKYAATSAEPTIVLAARLRKLGELLDVLHANWDVETIRQAFPSAWRWHLEGVWEASQHRERPFRQLVVLLQMAADGLEMSQFTPGDLTLWRECLNILRQPVVTSEELARCDEALIQRDFPVLLDFDDDLVSSYVAES